MKKKHLQPLTPAALYARVSSDRQDVDLSVSAQLRALKEYARANGYSVAREYVDEAESGRVADRPQFREMIEEGGKPKAPFEVILVWKFSRFTRKREHAVAFKSQLRRKGIRVVSITEQAEDNATGRLLEGIIESVDEYYSENLAQEVVRGMREAASRGFFLASNAPFGYRKIKVQDGPKERPSLEVDPAMAPVVKEIFEKSLRGSGLKELCKELNDRGITNRGKRWYKGTLHYVLRNEAYTGTAVWGKTSKDGQAPDPVRVEGAWPALVSRELFDEVQQAMSERAPKVQRPGRVGSKYLLSGLLRCGVCGRPYRAQGAKSGQFAYYVCSTLHRDGAGTCSAGYLNAPKLETFVVEKIRERILNEETIVALVQLVAEEIDAMAGELSGRLEVVEAELGDVRKRLEKLYEAIETSELTLEVLSPRIMSLRHREEQLEAAREDAETQLEQRRVELPDTEEIARYVADFREFLKDGTIPEKKVLIRNFIEGIEVMGDDATLTYTVPMPSDGAMSESASVLDFVKSSPPLIARVCGTRTLNLQLKRPNQIFYGWWLVGLTLLTLTSIITPIFQGLGFFFVALERNFGWSRAVLSVPFSLSRVEGAILGPIEGYLTDHLGSRRMIILGLGVLGAGFIGFSMVQGVVAYYITFLVIFAGAGFGGFFPLIAAINNWFHRHRTKAMAIGMLGINLGALLAPLIGRAMDVYGWRALAMLLGIGVWVAAIPIAALVRDRPEDYGQFPDGDSPAEALERRARAEQDEDVDFTVSEAVRTMAFWGITAAHGFSAVASVTIAVHIVPAMTDIGMSLPQAGTVVLTYGVAGAISQVAAGFMGDRLPKQPLIFVSATVQGLGMVVAATVTTFSGAYLFAVLYGIGLGARVPLLTAIRGDFFGRRNFATILGVSQVPMNFAMVGAPIAAGYLFDTLGSYSVAFMGLAVFNFLGAGMILVSRKPKPPVREPRRF